MFKYLPTNAEFLLPIIRQKTSQDSEFNYDLKYIYFYYYDG